MRYTTVTIDTISESATYTEAVAAGMSNTAISPFVIVDIVLGEIETLFFSHRLGKLQRLSEAENGSHNSDLRIIASAILKNEDKQPVWVDRFSDKPELKSEYLEGLIDDFNDM